MPLPGCSSAQFVQHLLDYFCSSKALENSCYQTISQRACRRVPSEPSNFRPIALTPSTGKLFSTILRNRWLDFMLSNGYLNRSIQKAFLPVTPGCTEHHLKLASVLAEARRKQKSLSVCWLDLANAYGSVHHSLKACLHCGKMNPDPIRIQSGSVVSGSDVVRLRPHCNNRKKILTSEHHVQPHVPSAWRVAHARAELINFE